MGAFLKVVSVNRSATPDSRLISILTGNAGFFSMWTREVERSERQGRDVSKNYGRRSAEGGARQTGDGAAPVPHFLNP